MHDFSRSTPLVFFCGLIFFSITLIAFMVSKRNAFRLSSVTVGGHGGPDLLSHQLSRLTVQLPVEKYGLPGEVDEHGEFHLRLPPDIKRVFFEVGLFTNPSFCDVPARHPDVFVFAWEANEESWAMHHDRCFKASGGKYVALPFAAADSEKPMVWNTHAAQDACASLAGGAGAGFRPQNWIDDPVERASARCNELMAEGKPMFLWDNPLSAAQVITNVPMMIDACEACKKNHAQGINQRTRVPTLSLEAVLLSIPSEIIIERVRIDAQGADLAVLKSARSQLHRIQTVNLEAQDLPTTDPDFLYGGPLVKSLKDIVNEMRQLGFVSYSEEVNNCACLEYNLNFAR